MAMYIPTLPEMFLAEMVHYRRCIQSKLLVVKHMKIGQRRHLYLFRDNSILVSEYTPKNERYTTMYILPEDSRYEYYLRRIKP